MEENKCKKNLNYREPKISRYSSKSNEIIVIGLNGEDVSGGNGRNFLVRDKRECTRKRVNK